MTITIDSPAPITVTVEGRGYATAASAATVAAKRAGYTTRGSKYFDEKGEPTGLLNRDEAALIFRGYRWIVEVDGRWYVTLPVN